MEEKKQYNRWGPIEAYGISESGTHTFDRILGGVGFGQGSDSEESVLPYERALIPSKLTDDGPLIVTGDGTYDAPANKFWRRVIVTGTGGASTTITYKASEKKLIFQNVNFKVIQ